MAHEAWKKLEELFEGTQAVKGAKAYIGHYSSEKWFGYHNTKPSVGRYND